MRWNFVFASASSLLLSMPIAAQVAARTPHRAVMPKAMADAARLDPAQTAVVVKLAEGRPGLVRNGAIADRDVQGCIGGASVRPFFAVCPEALATIRARQVAAAPPGEVPPVDLGLYFEVSTPTADAAHDLVVRLNALAAVEIAYARELPAPPPGDIPPVTPDFTAQQSWRSPPPTGIGADTMLYTMGASGTGLRLLDIEWGWNFAHEDLSQLRPGSLVGPPISQPTYNNHGDAVIGELTADADPYGVTGCAPDTRVLVATDYPSGGYSVANAIAVGLPSLQSGDVMVLEAQTSTPLGLGPTEWVQADFDAILIATGLGVITVEAAGNGGVDLDSPSLGGLFNIGVRDSGAILVGASNGSALSRASFSCFGSRIDANGWGANVVSTGYGDLFNPGDVRQTFTATFSGTSSATPMVAGTVIALRGAASAQLDPAAAAALDAFAIRSLLRGVGTPVPTISRRPDVPALLAASGITTGLSMRDEPRTGQTCHIDLQPAFTPAPGDLFAFAGSLLADNRPMPAPFPGRLLLDAATSSPLGLGGLPASGPATLPVTVPAHLSFVGVRYHVQAFTLQAATGVLAATNGVQLLVRR